MNHSLFFNLYQIFTLVKDFEQGCFGNSGLALQEWPPSRSLPYTKSSPSRTLCSKSNFPAISHPGFSFSIFLYKKFEKKNPTKKLEKEVEFTL